MKRIIIPIAGVALLSLAVLPQTASAQTPATAYRYCLEEQTGSLAGGGPLPLLCRFHTLQQCMASRSSPADRCMLNPHIRR